MDRVKHTSLIKSVWASLLVVMLSSGAKGQIVDYNFDLVLRGAPNTADYKVGDHFLGSVSIDSSELTNLGDEVAIIGAGLESIHITFIDDFTYDHNDDPSNGYPRAYLTDGVLTGFDLWNSKGLKSGIENTFFRFFRDRSFQYSPRGDGEFDGVYSLSLEAVPEPSSSMLSLIGISCLLFLRNKSI